ncbi:rhomboid family intramembrane serine protease [Dermatobacter hominis]|uniref:rhomboid family intramembrane serine protease n=1 Tax=Dermatobacter hominis TaxID=2884263 RepID=UPI001D12733E|nr:rhomboid family intramembrane serine protease [Dermatobacter hominis]UDY37146.1 rhomboid family intramembrane serine protease [Dermatobacter hominis]
MSYPPGPPTAPDPAQPTCYRHPDRPAGVGCQRCGRPICPQCMVQASVGYQCPDCTHARPQKVVSGAAAFGRGGGDVIVGKVLIAINVVAYVLMVTVGGSVSSPQGSIFEQGGTWAGGVATGDWWRVVTGGFLHASPLHLLMNMFLLWLLAKELEPSLGHLRFGLVYAVSLVGGSFGVIVLSPDTIAVGASGAIFGLLGALVVLQLRSRQNPWNTGVGGLLVINLVITFLVPGISIGGHIGGMVAGALAGLLVTPEQGPRTTVGLRDGFLALTAVGLGVLAVVAAGAVVPYA